MKLILLKDVKNLGKQGAIIEVADGYARNYLLPRRLAAPATEGVVRAREKEKADLAARQARELEQARQWAAELEAQPVEVGARVGEGGKLFGSVTSQDVAEALKARYARDFDKRKIQMDAIKSLGDHAVVIKVFPEVSAKVTLRVVAKDA